MESALPPAWPAIERGAGRTVLFLHGYPLNHEMWQSSLNALSKDHHVVLLDLPGYGLARDWPVPDTLAGFSEKLQLTIASRFPGPIVLVGHSFGGYLALQLYRDAPEQFSGLVLTNTRSQADTPEARAKRLETVQQLEEAGGSLDTEAVARSLVAPATWASGGAPVETVRSMVREVRPTTVTASLRAIADRPDLTPVLASIAVPTLVVWGEDDQLIPPEQTQAMVAQIPRSVGVGLTGAGHLPSLETPGPFVNAVHELLDRVEKAGGTAGGPVPSGPERSL